MIFWLPSGLRDASTTEGDEYELDVTHVQCCTKKSSMNITLPITVTRVSSPKIPNFRGVVDLAAVPLLELGVKREEMPFAGGALAAFFLSFFEGVTAPGEASPLLALSSSSSAVSGTVGSMYTSSMLETAMAAATQTTGVRVSMRRTMTPAK
jgi:hypothetical protein